MPQKPIVRGGSLNEATGALEPLHHALVARVSTDWWRAQVLDDRDVDIRMMEPRGLGPDEVWQRD